QDHIRPDGARLPETLASVCRLVDEHLLGLEVDPAEQPDRGLVVDYEYPRHKRPLYPWALSSNPDALARAPARDRQFEHEARALARIRVDPDPPTHGPDEPLDDEQPEPRAARRVGGAVELPEDPLVLVGRDPDALVGDAQLDGVGPPARR